ncbi:unnamed protein product [Closterium sp. NIES-53]
MWSFAVRYAAHQLNLWPCVSQLETSPTLLWMGEVGDASAFWVWGLLVLVRDSTAGKLSPRTIRCVFHGFPNDAHDWQFYNPVTRRVLSSHDVTFDGAVTPRYTPLRKLLPQVCLRSHHPPMEVSSDPASPAEGGDPAADDTAVSRRSPPLETPGFPPWLSLPPQQPDVVDSGAVGGGESGGAGSEGAGPGGGDSGDSGGAGDGGAGSSGAGGAGARGAGGTGAVDAGAGGAGRSGARGVGARGAGGSGAGGYGARGAGSSGAGGVGAGGAREPSVAGPTPLLCPPTDPSHTQLPPDSPLPTRSPYIELTDSLTERREPTSRPTSPVARTPHARCVHPPPVPGTHVMTLRPSSAPQHVVLPLPPSSSLPNVPDPESVIARASSPTVTRCPATLVSVPTFESAVVSALVAELVDFATASRIYYFASLVELECLAAAVPHLAAMLLAPDPPYLDAVDISNLRSYTEAITIQYSSQWQTVMDTEMASWKSTGTYRDYELHSLEFLTAFLQGSLHEEIWLRCPPGFIGSFPEGTHWSLRRPVYGLHQMPHEWHGTLRTTLATLGFSPLTTDPSLFLRTDPSLPPFYILVYVNELVFATSDTEALALVKAELQKML